MTQAWRKVGRLAAALAIAMFVATGASHDLLHLDEPAAHAAEAQAPQGADHASAATAHVVDIHADLPADGCSAHSASAHAADRPPEACGVATPLALRVDWRSDAADVADDLSLPTPHGPPRA